MCQCTHLQRSTSIHPVQERKKTSEGSDQWIQYYDVSARKEKRKQKRKKEKKEAERKERKKQKEKKRKRKEKKGKEKSTK